MGSDEPSASGSIIKPSDGKTISIRAGHYELVALDTAEGWRSAGPSP